MLVLQVGQALAGIAAARELRQRAFRRAPALRSPSHFRQHDGVAPVGIEQFQLVAALEQRLVLVLAMDFHQQRTEFRQLRQGRRPAVDPGARAAVGADHASQLAAAAAIRAGLVELVVGEPGARFRAIVQCEFRRKLGALGAVADHRGIGARAGQAQQGVHQQRFAGAVSPETTVRRGSSASSAALTTAKSRKVEVGEHGPGDFA
jgi:hypothetical protein